jgi:hypothetical protein
MSSVDAGVVHCDGVSVGLWIRLECLQAGNSTQGKCDQMSCMHGRAPRRQVYIYSMNEEERSILDIKIKQAQTDERHR